MKTIEQLTISDKVYDEYGDEHNIKEIERRGINHYTITIVYKGFCECKSSATLCKSSQGKYFYFNKSEALSNRKEVLLKDLRREKERLLDAARNIKNFREQYWEELNEYCTDENINKLKRLGN